MVKSKFSKIFLVMLLVFCLWSCFTKEVKHLPSDQPNAEKFVETPNADISSCTLFHDPIVNRFYQLSEDKVILSLFANPASNIVQNIETNEYDESLKDTIFSITLHNNRYWVYGVVGKRFIDSEGIFENDFVLYQGLKIGMNKEEIEKIIDQDIPDACTELVIFCEEETAELIITFKQGLVFKIFRMSLV
jgi:hypothetical protein